MLRTSARARGGQSDSLRWLIALLLITVVVPTACVLWFMTEAMQNERLAVRQKLSSLHQGQLEVLGHKLDNIWEARQLALEAVEDNVTAAEVFANLMKEGVADSVIVFDQRGRVAYPAFVEHPIESGGEREGEQSSNWARASQLEHAESDPRAAVLLYADIAHKSKDANVAARALQAQARCKAKLGEREDAIELLGETLSQDRYRRAVDSQGRLIALNAQFLALDLIGDSSDPRFRPLLNQLRDRLGDYSDPSIGAAQRRHLMGALQSLLEEEDLFPTLQAEVLAASYLESDPGNRRASSLYRTGLPGVLQKSSSTGRVLALYSEASIIKRVYALGAAHGLAGDVRIEVLLPGGEVPASPPLVSLALGKHLKGWRLALHVDDPSLLDTAADKRVVSYLWTGILVILVIVVAAGMIGGSIRGQVRLASLKNDLVATVSHELKTPLSSTRLLVDTLLHDEHFDAVKVRDYLELIAKENTRLSHLIDNFLTFSRMQRNKLTFTLVETDAAAITSRAAEVAGDKFNQHDCRLTVESLRPLPKIMADADALVTVVLNLLDNAYKYSDDDKQITLRSRADSSHFFIEVVDNGIGLSARAAKKVFDRFFQVDQRLSRESSGCGLGLSIVRSIVQAHAGSVSVESEPGCGSTFKISIPIAHQDAPRAPGGQE